MKYKALLLLLSFPCLCAIAQETTVVSAVAPKVFELQINPHPTAYPPEVTNTGAQGSVVVSIVLDQESKVSSAVVKQSSGDEVLDNLALKLLLRPIKLSYKESENYSKEEIKVTFKKDTLLNMRDKTCKDAIADAGYFKKMNPDKAERDLPFWGQTAGFMFITYSSQKEYVKGDYKKILDDTIAECQVNPEANVFDTYRRIAKIKP
jgi:TonB family protein